MPTLRQFGRKFAVVLALVAALAAGPVSAAERVPNDTHFDKLWYLRHMGVTEAWNRTLGFEGVIVAVIDTGVDIDHPDLKDNIWRNTDEIAGNGVDDDRNGYVDDVHGWDFLDGDADPRPVLTGDLTREGANHGTVGAGVIAASGDNGIGVVGVTWQTAIMPLRVLDSRGIGDPTSVEFAVRYALENGAKVINLSFAGTYYSPGLRDALRYAYDNGVFIVAAAGNAPEGRAPVDLNRQPLYPVCLDADDEAGKNFIYGVASTDEQDRHAAFSNYGANCVDGSAPGVRVISTQAYRSEGSDFDRPYGGLYEGTSVSAPMVSGVAALLLAVDRTLTPQRIGEILGESAFPIDALNPSLAGKLGRGRINAARAVELLSARPEAPAAQVSTVALLPEGTDGLIAVASGGQREAEIRLFTTDGLFVRSFPAFAAGFTGGVSLSSARADGPRRNSLVAGALAGGAPQVRVFDYNARPYATFMAYDERFRGGVDVAAGDLDGDGRDEVVTGAGVGGGPHVRTFSLAGAVKGGFFAFDSARRSGVDVAVGDLDGDGRAEIVASAPDESDVRVFDAKGQQLGVFQPFGGKARGVSRVEVEDLEGDGSAEIVVVWKQGATQTVFAYEMSGYGRPIAGPLRLVGSPRGSAPLVSLRLPGSMAALSFFAFEPRYLGGVTAVRLD